MWIPSSRRQAGKGCCSWRHRTSWEQSLQLGQETGGGRKATLLSGGVRRPVELAWLLLEAGSLTAWRAAGAPGSCSPRLPAASTQLSSCRPTACGHRTGAGEGGPAAQGVSPPWLTAPAPAYCSQNHIKDTAAAAKRQPGAEGHTKSKRSECGGGGELVPASHSSPETLRSRKQAQAQGCRHFRGLPCHWGRQRQRDPT